MLTIQSTTIYFNVLLPDICLTQSHKAFCTPYCAKVGNLL